MNFTPGPWEIEPNAGKGAWIGNDFGWAALALGNDHENARANARLIGAAPEMYALLVELIDIEGPQPGTGDWYEKVRAVLDKAGGNGGD